MEISATTKILGVIGDPISHSMSPTMHNAVIHKLGLDYVYVAFNIKGENLCAACDGFRAMGISGINVTIPHKIEVMRYLDDINPIALGIGAVNTIKSIEGKSGVKLIGKNTDADGALISLINANFDPSNKKCVIIGAGGASRAVSFILGTKAKEIIITDIINETAESLKENLIEFYSNPKNTSEFNLIDPPLFRTVPLKTESVSNELQDTDLLINATPVGMHPLNGISPLDKLNIKLNSKLFVFDVIYNPLETKLLADAKIGGCRTLSGINMLVNQGAIAFEWWTGKKPDLDIMTRAALKKLNVAGN